MLLEDHFPGISHVFAHSQVSFQRDCIAIVLELKRCLSLEHVAIKSTSHHKRLRLPKLGSPFPAWNHWVCRCHRTLFASLFQNLDSGHWHKNDDALDSAIAVSNKLSFVSDQESCVMYQHPQGCGSSQGRLNLWDSSVLGHYYNQFWELIWKLAHFPFNKTWPSLLSLSF